MIAMDASANRMNNGYRLPVSGGLPASGACVLPELDEGGADKVLSMITVYAPNVILFFVKHKDHIAFHNGILIGQRRAVFITEHCYNAAFQIQFADEVLPSDART